MRICWLLPRLVGFGRATEHLMLGDMVTAEHAFQIGLANQVVTDSDLDSAVNDCAARLQALAPWGLAMTKGMLSREAAIDYSTAIETEAWTQSLLMSAGDFREFHAAFTAKRPPRFIGS